MPQSTNESNLITLLNPKSPISEAYRKLRTNIQFSFLDTPMKVLMVASAQVDEGKTTTISNLAVAYAQEGKKVLLLDADLRKPSLHHVLAQNNRNGLTNILTDQIKWQEALKTTGVDNLSLIVSGPIPPNPSEMLGNHRMNTLIKDLKEHFDIVLIDTPPVLAVTDSLIVSSLCDGVIMVVAAGKAEKEMVKKAKASLEHVNARIIGAVLNNLNRKDVKSSFKNVYGTAE
ncbi:CpsD/CapB family tyrosine-protein kinase [Paenibacillus sepulcri]|uniref:non-specific protein-tyrosine kinase n=1 Tax=Paenibacillus sepulcri TaxID=359917 RepID=A0ABS7BXW3_9BACL|nr:CpsD/CapB family tyrosine-protein kinase [Paenibacillus sepulcri]